MQASKVWYGHEKHDKGNGNGLYAADSDDAL